MTGETTFRRAVLATDMNGTGGARTAGVSANRAHDRRDGHRWLFRALRFLAHSGRYGRLHRLAVDRLFASGGDRVLAIGCGPGVDLGTLAAAVGEEGRVVALDAGPRTVDRARERSSAADGRSSVVRGDAGTLPFPGGAFDRAFTTLVASAVPDVAAAVGEVARVLRPGGRFVVLGARPFRTLPLAVLGPFPASARTTGRRLDADVPALLRERFDPVHVETFGGESAFVATAELSGNTGGPNGR